MEENRKQRMTLVLILLAVITLTIIGTYAFFVAQINVNGEQKLTIKTSTLALIFEDGNGGIEAELEFGKSVEKTFTIENTGALETTATMYFDNLINTYTLGSLTYTLKYSESEEGEYTDLITNCNVPESKEMSSQILYNGIVTSPNKKYFYKLIITLNYLDDVDQTQDLNAIFSTNFGLAKTIQQDDYNALETLFALGLKPNEKEPDFSQASKNDETADGLYAMEDDYGTSYYFRGAVKNNYVEFAGYYWRIIRINGDGSIRMIYDGTKPHANASTDSNRYPVQTKYNTTSDDNKSVGYMYGGDIDTNSTSKDQAQSNDTESNIKIVLDDWYKKNIEEKNYGKYIADEIFCNDRSIVSGEGYGTEKTYYGAYERFVTNAKTSVPLLKCPEKNDAFTVDDKVNGNGDLKYPVGLITIDEVVAAGNGKYNTENKSFYLYNGKYFWSMTPGYYDSNAYILDVNGFADIGVRLAEYTIPAIPVINIKAEYAKKIAGTGIMTDPYMIKETVFLVPEAIKAIKNNQTPSNVNDKSPDFTLASTTDEGVYFMEDDYGTSYYFRGRVYDNYVYFAGYYWRIIRINGDGSIRMIYDGTKPHGNASTDSDRYPVQTKYNTTSNDNKYVGYMYGGDIDTNSTSKDQAQSNDTESNIKIVLDDWYKKI